MKSPNTRLFISTFILLGALLSACGRGEATPTGPESAAPQEQEEVPQEPVEQVFTGDVDEIVFFNWSEYIDPEIYALFQDEFGIEVTEDNFSSNEDMLAKLQGLGNSESYALIVPSDYTVAIMIQEGMLAELNHDNIPNLANLGDRFKSLPYDPGNKYCVPYQWGTTGLGYDSAQVDEPASWAVVFNPDPAAPSYGRLTMLDDVRESFAAALIYLGYDINTTNESQLEEAKQLLINAKAGVAGYDSDTYEDLVASGENLMAHGWNGDFLVAQEENENLIYTIPREGGVTWVDNLCIPATASPAKKAAAESFINFLLRPDIGALLSEYNYYASPNAAAEALLSPDFLSDPAVYPPPEQLANLQFIEPLGEFESVYQRLWDEVKAASP